MTNLFDSSNYTTTEPETLTLGDRWVWKREDLGSDYAPASYALSYNVRLQGVHDIQHHRVRAEARTKH